MLDFLKKLLPNFEQNKIYSSIDKLENNLKLNILTIDSYRRNLSSTDDVSVDRTLLTLHSKYAQRFEQDCKRIGMAPLLKPYTVKTGIGTMEVISVSARQLLNHIDMFRKYAKELFNKDIDSNSLSFKQIEVLKLIDLSHFWASYTLTLFNYVIWEDLMASGSKTDRPVTDAKFKWLNDNYNTYLELTKIFLFPIKMLDRVIDSISDLSIVEAGDNAALLGVKADPLRLGFMPVVGDLILNIRLRSVQKENNIYECNKLKCQVLQLQLQALKDKHEGKEITPAVQKQINYITDRIKNLEYKINKYEEDAGV